MKKLILGLLALTSFSAFSMQYRGKLVAANCSSYQGVGEVEVVIAKASEDLFDDRVTYKLLKFNVVNSSLCKKGDFSSVLTTMTDDAMMSGELHELEISGTLPTKIVTKMTSMGTDSKLSKYYQEFDLTMTKDLKVEDYRLVKVMYLSNDLASQRKAQDLINKAQAK